MTASESGIATSPVLVTRRTVGRGMQIITVTGENWREVQREAASVWRSADVWLRQHVPPFAQPAPDGGFEATTYVDHAE